MKPDKVMLKEVFDAGAGNCCGKKFSSFEAWYRWYYICTDCGQDTFEEITHHACPERPGWRRQETTENIVQQITTTLQGYTTEINQSYTHEQSKGALQRLVTSLQSDLEQLKKLI